MATDLLKIPGVEGKRRRRPRQLHGPPYGRRSSRPRSPGGRGRPRRRWTVSPGRRLPWVTIGLGLGYLAIVLYGLHAAWSATRVNVAVDGIADRERITSAAVAERVFRFTIDPAGSARRATLRFDGVEVKAREREIQGDTMIWRPGALKQGDHEVALSVDRAGLGDSEFRRRFVIDDTPPRLDVAPLLPPTGVCDPITVPGRVEAGSTVTLDGQPLRLENGRFTLRYDRPPAAPLRLVATDRAGNRTESEVIAPVRYPGGQGVHVTAAAWGYQPLRDGVLALIDAGLVSAIELDLKDEGGVVGYDSQVPLAAQVGAVRPEYKIRQTVADLKSRGVRVIGRIVSFRDPLLARWAWDNGRRDWVVQNTTGEMLGSYGGFTNFTRPEVQQYNLDIALEAADAGVDDILWDYVRRPEGDPATMVIPGLPTTTADAMVEFLTMTHAALRRHCVYQGASVFGIAADRPGAVGQDVPRIARHVDYVAPMLYPSHWVPGEYRVANPNKQPFDIVKATLADFQAKTAGTGKALVPWLQDFSLGHPYGPDEVRAQIDAAAELGVPDWLLWNGGVRYTAGALDAGRVRLRR